MRRVVFGLVAALIALPASAAEGDNLSWRSIPGPWGKAPWVEARDFAKARKTRLRRKTVTTLALYGPGEFGPPGTADAAYQINEVTFWCNQGQFSARRRFFDAEGRQLGADALEPASIMPGDPMGSLYTQICDLSTPSEGVTVRGLGAARAYEATQPQGAPHR